MMFLQMTPDKQGRGQRKNARKPKHDIQIGRREFNEI